MQSSPDAPDAPQQEDELTPQDLLNQRLIIGKLEWVRRRLDRLLALRRAGHKVDALLLGDLSKEVVLLEGRLRGLFGWPRPPR